MAHKKSRGVKNPNDIVNMDLAKADRNRTAMAKALMKNFEAAERAQKNLNDSRDMDDLIKGESIPGPLTKGGKNRQ